MLVDQALEKIIGNAVDRVVDKSIAGYSTHSPGSVSSDLTEEQDADEIESGEDDSEQESMDVDEMAGSMTEDDYDDNESSEDDDDEMADLFSQYRSTLSNPWPGFISRIDVFGNNEFDLAVNKDMQLVLVSTREGTTLPDHLENSRQWECIHAKKWLRLRNVATRKYLGVDQRESKEVYHSLLRLFDHPKWQTKFSLERRSTDCAWLESPFGELCSLMVKPELEEVRSDNFVGGLIHVAHNYNPRRPEQAMQLRPSEKLDE